VCDNFVAVMGDQAFTDLPGGIEQYLDSRRKMLANATVKTGAGNNLVGMKVSKLSPARERELRKATDKFERQLSKIEVQIGVVHDQMLEFSHDFERVAQCDVELRELNESKETIELQWIQAADELSGQGG
jgi:ATP-binding cassette subfamily F protein uup